jgi:hypothetical protein
MFATTNHCSSLFAKLSLAFELMVLLSKLLLPTSTSVPQDSTEKGHLLKTP